MQFWEDVDDTLNDVEVVYEGKGLNIDRIRDFAKRSVIASNIDDAKIIL